MNGSLDLSLHAWRGIGPDVEPDLFMWRYRLGFLTLTVCRVCVLSAYQDAKAEASKLRGAMVRAIHLTDQQRTNDDGKKE